MSKRSAKERMLDSALSGAINACDSEMVNAIQATKANLEKQRRLESIVERNEKQAVSDDERLKVRKLNQNLKGEFPKNRPRYDEIAKQLSISSGRVRYIVEGPRRKE